MCFLFEMLLRTTVAQICLFFPPAKKLSSCVCFAVNLSSVHHLQTNVVSNSFLSLRSHLTFPSYLALLVCANWYLILGKEDPNRGFHFLPGRPSNLFERSWLVVRTNSSGLNNSPAIFSGFFCSGSLKAWLLWLLLAVSVACTDKYLSRLLIQPAYY